MNLVYPLIAMMFLTIYLYVKNYLDNRKATKNKEIKYNYFKAYKGEVPEYVAVSRQTLKNQFELPLLFYVTLLFMYVSGYNISTQINWHVIFAWLFVLSRYLHCYIRLTSNHIPSRAKSFQFGLIVLVLWWIYFLFNYHF
mgnify:FL=1|tara:strand:- start:124 stop:543 length:420 start_codon:yes stop_codon:yes gene_type:complete